MTHFKPALIVLILITPDGTVLRFLHTTMATMTREVREVKARAKARCSIVTRVKGPWEGGIVEPEAEGKPTRVPRVASVPKVTCQAKVKTTAKVGPYTGVLYTTLCYIQQCR